MEAKLKLWVIRSLLIIVPLSILGGVWIATRPSEHSQLSYFKKVLLLSEMNAKDIKELKWFIEHPKEDSTYQWELQNRGQDLILYFNCRERVRNYLKVKEHLKSLRQTPFYKRDYALRKLFLPADLTEQREKAFLEVLYDRSLDSGICARLKAEGRDYEKYIRDREAVRAYLEVKGYLPYIDIE